jgi:hypothetical protein
MTNFLTAPKTNPDLLALLEKAQAKYDAMTPEQRREMWRAQRRSFIRGEAGMGGDADEAAYRIALQANDAEALQRLDAESKARVESAEKWMGENGY